MDIFFVRHKLTDGSDVYNVEIKGLMHAVSECDAEYLLEAITGAIAKHTVDDVRVIDLR